MPSPWVQPDLHCAVAASISTCDAICPTRATKTSNSTCPSLTMATFLLVIFAVSERCGSRLRSCWEKSTDEILRTIRIPFRGNAYALSNKALCAGPDIALCPRRNRLPERRNDQRTCRSSRADGTGSPQCDQLLLHADHSPARQVQRPGLHQHCVPVARR